MWRWTLMFVVMTSAVAEAGQVRSSFQVGLTITGRVNAPGVIPQAQAGSRPVPLPRPRPALLTKSQGKPSLAANGE
jgi:hypothetical protein